MAHTALARRYRPRHFSEVATQEHVSETLRRAVAGDRVGHAYLFCGPRGVGKTTLARVLAMALNCPHRGDDGEPCGECESCRRIWAGTTSLDVVEIDAASNRGVDDARELRSRAMYAPSEEGRFKVYIVDEAHMLTREAWNALLKVLEEPPERVIFIFATTEPEKIEQTAAPILSRCQRFDFRRLAVPEIVARLREVLAGEELEAADDALRLLARKADGGMRDALSLTDQVLALSEGTGVTLEVVRRILGVVEDERFLEAMDLLASRDRAGIFRLVEELLDQGYDLVEFYHGFMEALRTLVRIRVGDPVTDLPEEKRQEWEVRAQAFDAGDLLRMLSMAAELETGGSLRRSSQPRVLLELLLLRFSYLDRTVDVETLLAALGDDGTGDPAPAPAGGPPRGRPTAPPEPAAQPGPATPRGSTAPRAPAAPQESAPSDGAPAGPPPASPTDHREGEPSKAKTAAGPRAAGPRVADPPGDLLPAWKAFLQKGEGIPAGLTPFLMGARAFAAGAGVLGLALPEGPAAERLSDPKERRALERGLAAEAAADEVEIQVEVQAPEADTPEERISQDEVRAGRLGDLLEKEPGLEAAVEQWDLEIVD